jgi:hypothetical protein
MTVQADRYAIQVPRRAAHRLLRIVRCASGRVGAGRALLLLGAALAGAVPLSGQATYEIGPPPAWVERISVPIEEPSPDTTAGGTALLLLDIQDRVRDSRLETFVHTGYRLLDEGAVQSSSQLEIEFDPSYQNLTLHAVAVIRNGTVMDQLQPDRIHLMRREQRLEFQIYDGSVSVAILLEDVRPGDVVEYSYTREGSNPFFAGHYAKILTTEASVPLHRLRFRLLWPSTRPLFVRPSTSGLEPQIREVGAYREYLLDRRHVPPRLLDGNLPSWYSPFSWVQFSDFATWSDVAAWGHALFRPPERVPGEIDSVLAVIRSRSATVADRVVGALRFVQDEVRYLAVSIGINALVPQPPTTVMRRRFGDCKDKSLLLMTMLRELGVESSPALVSTRYGGHLDDFHPTAQVFDHVIVRARVDGQIHWLDPSTFNERGALEDVVPLYGATLALDSAVDAPEVIALPRPSNPLTDIAVHFGLGAVGEPVEMRVRTTYARRNTNSARRRLQNTPTEELEKSYLDYYSQIYASIESRGPLEIEDIEDANVITTEENYAISEFWQFSEDLGVHVGDFYALELGDLVPGPTPANRTMPFAVEHPVSLRYTIEASLEDGWSIEPEHELIETPAVHFEFTAKARGELLTLTYDYRTLADHVRPEDFPEHMREMGRIRDLLGFSVTAPGGSDSVAPWWDPRELNWPILFTALFMTGVALYAGLRVYRLSPSTWPQPLAWSGEGPRGLGGWLILVGLGVTLSPLMLVTGFVSTLPAYTATSWSSLTTPASAQYHALWAPLLIFELCTNITFIVFSVFLAVAFYRRVRVFPGLFVGYTAAGVAVMVLDAVLSRGIPSVAGADQSDWGSAPAGFVFALIWIAYMFRSQRVRNTFVN